MEKIDLKQEVFDLKARWKMMLDLCQQFGCEAEIELWRWRYLQPWPR